jgi:hypothetical protein
MSGESSMHYNDEQSYVTKKRYSAKRKYPAFFVCG